MHRTKAPLRACLAALALALGGCPPPEADAPIAAAPPPPMLPAPAPPSAAPPRGQRVKVLYRDDWFGGVTLLGIDANGPKAAVRLESESPKRLAIDLVDLEHGVRTDRWDVTDDVTRSALLGRGFPLSSGQEGSVARFAKLMASLGPWHMRPALPTPTFAVTADRSAILFGAPPADGRDGDWLMAVDRDGRNPKRVDEGLRASYSPVFSPDGAHFAFRGCTSSPCDYGLFLAQLGQKPHRVGGISGSTPPVFSKSGDALYVVGNGSRSGTRCLFKASVGAAGSPTSLQCVAGLDDVSFTEDPEGRTGVISGVRGVPGQQHVDFTWVLLEDGTMLQQHSVDRAIGGGMLNGAGLLALPMQKGALALVDLVNDKSAVVPESEGWFFGFDSGRWLGDWLVVMRKPEGSKGYEIVGLDARDLLGERAAR